MILCVGEILVDMIGTNRDGSFFYERKAGGAPFNVACGVKQFGAQSAFVGCVGDDIIGNFLEKFARARDLDVLLLKRDETRNTTLAFVELDEQGERSFCFFRKNTADYILPEVDEETFAKSDIVHIGSLMLSEKEGREYAGRLARRAREAGKLVSFDVNFRTDIFRDEAEAVRLYKEQIALADIVKFSEDEVETFGKDYADGLKEKLVCISLGKRGCRWQFRGEGRTLETIDIKPVDTTGAGDAFYAGVLSRLDGTSPCDWTDETLSKALQYGNVCGALNTLGHGAIDNLPTREEIARWL